MKYFLKTFGCAQNWADSERITSLLKKQGMIKAKKIEEADQVIINTCMIRKSAENRVYGLINNLRKKKALRQAQGGHYKIIVTGCMVGMAFRDKTGKFLKLLKKRMPLVDEFLPIEEIGFEHAPLRSSKENAWVPISTGCNNFCSYCVVPFSRGREVSRPYEEIMSECIDLVKQGYKKITLLGMNVNSYGADLILKENTQDIRDLKKTYFKQMENFPLLNGRIVKPILVKHLGKMRIPTLFPYLLEDVAKIKGLEVLDFLSSNPWDFSEELIEVINRNKKITKVIHLPVQSGSNTVLQRMNRWYTRNEYLKLVANLKFKIKNLKLSTDIIVGFCGETEEEFAETVDLAKKVGFLKAYVALYSERPMTAAQKSMVDDVPYKVKKQRWLVLENLINQPQLKKHAWRKP